jgi:hypothetical protein
MLKARPVLSSVGIVAGFLVLSCFFFIPRWETNDDVAMSMVAHGYGIAATGSANLVFSSVLWGYVVRAIPAMGGVTGYSIATFLELWLAGSAILYFLRRLGVEPYAATLFTLLVMLQPALFPQFTLNAGLLTVAAVLGFWTYARAGNVAALGIAAALAFWGYLVRSQEFFFVMLIALPLVASSRVRTDRTLQFMAALLITLVFAAALFERSQYAGSEWQSYNDLNAARAAFTDFGAADQLRLHPEILKRYGYSQNDLSLIQHFFFADPKIANPKALKAMLADLGAATYVRNGLSEAYASLRALFSVELIPLWLCALVFLLVRPRPAALASLLLLCTASFLTGLLGRGGVLRTDLPALDMLCALSLVFFYAPLQGGAGSGLLRSERSRNVLASTLVALALIAECWTLVPRAVDSMKRVRLEQAAAGGLPREVIVDWGAGLPLEYIFPLLANDAQARHLSLYPLGVFTLAPFSVATAEEAAGRGFVPRLTSPAGMLMVANQTNLEELGIWCAERLNGRFRSVALATSNVERVWCER